jgi:hypothetical protein
MRLCTALWAGSLLLMICTSSYAEPMRLDDTTPRWVTVRFEDSPSDHPYRLDNVYTKAFLAWLEPNALGHITVRVSGEILEQSLFRDRNPVPGSFTDFVWVFDRETGDVLSASFEGTFSYEFDWGFATSEIHASVRAEMQTTHVGGYQGARPVWGVRLYPWCNDVQSLHCTAVPTNAYDSDRGYVNAVGFLAIDSPLTQFATFSAVGEARFGELSLDFEPAPLSIDSVTVGSAVTQQLPGPGSATAVQEDPVH